jgi:hypothetical protein
MLSALQRLGVSERALDVRIGPSGVEEGRFPAHVFEHVFESLKVLEREGYLLEYRKKGYAFMRGWSFCLVDEPIDSIFSVRILDASLLMSSRTTASGLDWAGVSILVPPGKMLVAGPARPHLTTWSVASYFYGPIEFNNAVSLVDSSLRSQSPRVVGPWTLPDEVWFDVRALGVDARVRLKPCSLLNALYLFQRTTAVVQNPNVTGVMIEVTGAESLLGSSETGVR